MLQQVRDVLQQAGLLTGADRALRVEQAADGVRVLWRPEITRLGPPGLLGEGRAGPLRPEGSGGGVHAAMCAAVAAVLELAGFTVRIGPREVLVTGTAGQIDCTLKAPGAAEGLARASVTPPRTGHC